MNNSKNAQINKVKEALDSTIKALAADQNLQIEFDDNLQNSFFSWNQNLVTKEQKIILPQIKVAEVFSEENLIKRHRASFDMALCYFLFHDQALHQQNNFALEEQKLFDEFEKIRVISKIKNRYLGVAQNIFLKLESDIYSAFEAHQQLPLILLKEVFQEKILDRSCEAILEIEQKISAKILQKIKKLTKEIDNQQAFALEVRQLIEMLRQEQNSSEKKESDQDKNSEKNNKSADSSSFGSEDAGEKQDQENSSKSEEERGFKPIEQEQQIGEIKASEELAKAKVKSANQEEKDNKIEYKNAYKIFTSKFDEVVFPQKLVSKNELEMLRDQLDLKLSKLNNISKKMSLKLKRKLLARKNFLIERDNNHGVLDRKKLTRFVLDPFMEDIWINNKEHQYQDTALTILLDNSGSMRGAPIVMSALACEIIASILEKFSVKTEIIGFTTADWKGGKARKMWENSGKSKNPGRLNELRHIIYKSCDQNFKKSKINLGLMLKEGILKENIDGEALLFARSRLMQQDAARKILLVISDGTPIDDSTNSANDNDILTDHLHHVVSKIEKQSQIEIIGVGIGHQVGDFYKNSIAIKSLEELGDVMIEKIVGII